MEMMDSISISSLPLCLSRAPQPTPLYSTCACLPLAGQDTLATSCSLCHGCTPTHLWAEDIVANPASNIPRRRLELVPQDVRPLHSDNGSTRRMATARDGARSTRRASFRPFRQCFRPQGSPLLRQAPSDGIMWRGRRQGREREGETREMGPTRGPFIPGFVSC